MNKPGLVLVTLALSIAIAVGHDMAMADADDVAGPNSMSGQMCSGPHIAITPSRPQTPQDVERAHDVLDTLRRVLAKYKDSRVAFSEGYQVFLPTVPQEVYHFTDYDAANAEYQGLFDPERPGSLLYVKKGEGDYVLVGAMYSAPASYTPDQLNARIPLSVARWHEHVDICLPRGITLTDLLHDKIGADRTDLPGTLPVAANPEALDRDHRVGFMADGRFGFEGTIHDSASCQSAGGNFIPLAFGWMVHVYPFQGDDLKVAYGMNVPSVSTN
jgi:hypothetical protein